MRPGWDAVGCSDPKLERKHVGARPNPETLRALQQTAHSAVLQCPDHSIEIDRVGTGLLARTDSSPSVTSQRMPLGSGRSATTQAGHMVS